MKTKAIAKIKDLNQEWEEPFIMVGILSIDEMATTINNLCELFNSYLKPHETPRELVEIISLEIIP